MNGQRVNALIQLLTTGGPAQEPEVFALAQREADNPHVFGAVVRLLDVTGQNPDQIRLCLDVLVLMNPGAASREISARAA